MFLKNKDNLSFFSKLPDVSDKYLCTILSDGISIKKQSKAKMNEVKPEVIPIDDGNYNEKPMITSEKSGELDNKIVENKNEKQK